MWSQVMENDSTSAFEGFILVGFSDRPHLELILFVVVLTFYLLTLLGNMTIILLAVVDSRLHTPMYFFLANLSLLDMCFTTGSIPQMLYNLQGADKTISYLGCAIQLYFVLALAGWSVCSWLSWRMTATLQSADPCTTWLSCTCISVGSWLQQHG